MEYRCPHCHAPIYSRKNKICGGCEKPLPEKRLLADKQIMILKKQDEAIEQRAKEFRWPDADYGSDVGGSSF